MASSSRSRAVLNSWRVSDEEYFPEIFDPEPREFPRDEQPGEDYTLQARTRPQRTFGHDQEFVVHPEDLELENTGLSWLPTKVNDRLTVLAIEDATAYDSNLLQRFAAGDDQISDEELRDVRIWPDLDQYRHESTFTQSASQPNIQYHGTGNIDGFGVFCCQDCFLEARQQESHLLWAGPLGMNYRGDEEYTRLFDHNAEMLAAIALRKECSARETEWDMAMKAYNLQQKEEEAAAKAAADASSHVKKALDRPQKGTTATYLPCPVRERPSDDQLDPGYKWEPGWGCKICGVVDEKGKPLYWDRKSTPSGVATTRSLHHHVDTKHVGCTVNDVAVRTYYRQKKKAASESVAPKPKKRKAEEDEDDDDDDKEKKKEKKEEGAGVGGGLKAPPPKRRKVVTLRVRVPAAVDEQVNHAASLPEEVLNRVRFDAFEDSFLNLGEMPQGFELRGLVHHGGVPAIRAAAFRSRRGGAAMVDEGWWEDGENGKAVRSPPL